MNDELIAIVQRFDGRRVLVVGDVMLDQFIWGTVRRISPEAPVPIVEAERRSFMPGGAGNVACNIAALSGAVLLGGIIGDDGHGRLLCDELRNLGVDPGGLIPDSSRPTSTKTRIVAHSQQVVRVDEESKAPIDQEDYDSLLNWIGEQLSSVGACVLSDYGKGVLTPEFCQRAIALAKEANVPVIVDPKGTRYAKYVGATLLTPNLLEAEAATGLSGHSDEEIRAIAADLLNQLPGSSVLITRGAQGMSLFQPDGTTAHIPTAALAVYDVTGAGDTVISTLALAIASGVDKTTAATIANRAAGIAVGKLGTATVTCDELTENLQHDLHELQH